MFTALRAMLRRNPLLRQSYRRLRDAVELTPRKLQYRRERSATKKSEIDDPLTALKRDGLVILPEFVPPNVTAEMRRVADEAIAQGRFAYGGGKIGFEEPPSDIGSIDRMRVLDATLYSCSFIDYALNEFIVNIIKAYLGFEPVISGIMAYRTQPVSSSPKESFRWHYDDAPLQVKAICYLTEVTAEDGPFAYVKGTHKRRYGTGTYEETRLDDSAVPVEGRIQCLGKPGTVVIVDTNGIHRATPNLRGPRDVVSVLYEAGTGNRRLMFYNLPVPTQFIGKLKPTQRRMLRLPEYPG